MKHNEIWTIDDFVHHVTTQVQANQNVDINFAAEFLPDASEGDCWYGIKYPVRIFDEAYGMVAIGYYGGFSTKAYEITENAFDNNRFSDFLRFFFASNGIGNYIMVELKD